MGNLKCTIGRSSQCDYVIGEAGKHPTVSGNHAIVSETATPDVYLFEDHSTNGSYVNGNLVHNTTCMVKRSDHITLGRTYTLSLEDLEKRYFDLSRTTQRRHQSSELPNPINNDSLSNPIERHNTPHEKIKEPEVIVKTETVEKIPAGYWIFLIVIAIIAFCIGKII